MDDYYLMYGRMMTFLETKKFIDDYRNDILADRGDRYHAILNLIEPGSYVLDYGCGWGIFSEMIADRDCYVDGIDLDSHSIKIAKDIVGEKERLSFDNISILGVSDEKYDCVVSSQVIEHTHNPGTYLMHCNRVLKKNGYLVISLPNVINLKFLADQFFGFNKKFVTYAQQFVYDKTHHHIQAWDPLSFFHLLSSMGFEYVSHNFVEGIYLPKNRSVLKKTEIPGLSNLSYTMVFKVRKIKFVPVNPED